jgi:hypothetical protein
MINYDVPVNSYGNNANLRSNVLDDETMKSYSFIAGLYIEDLDNDISLTIKMSKESVYINVIDEDFGQPYDYQRILRDNPEHDIALDIHSKVQATMKRLSDAGIIEGYVANDYI